MRIPFKLATCVLVVGAVFTSAAADTKEAATLTEKLLQYYRPAKGASGTQDPARPKPLFVQQSNLLSVKPSDTAYLDVCPSIFRAGEVRPTPGYFCAELARKQQHNLGISEVVYVESLWVNSTADRVEVHLTTCAPCSDGSSSQPNLRSLVVFEFPKGYLSEASPSEVIRAMDTLLTAVPAGDAAPKEKPKSEIASSAPPGTGAAGPAAETKPSDVATIKKDQTPDEVQKLLGKPQSIVDLGPKLIYVYPNIRVQFLNGKLTDVQ